MESMVYKYCKADPGFWLKPETRPEDGVCITHIYCVLWMTLVVFIMMQMVCFSVYTGLYFLSQSLTVQTCT